ncbi:hypothetical protein IW261DRAFT_1600087, partial [Armillaria novae-zelandiae]
MCAGGQEVAVGDGDTRRGWASARARGVEGRCHGASVAERGWTGRVVTPALLVSNEHWA